MDLFLGCSLLIQAVASANWQRCFEPTDVLLAWDNEKLNVLSVILEKRHHYSAEDTFFTAKPYSYVDRIPDSLTDTEIHTIYMQGFPGPISDRLVKKNAATILEAIFEMGVWGWYSG